MHRLARRASTRVTSERVAQRGLGAATGRVVASGVGSGPNAGRPYMLCAGGADTVL
jgi:hypothetical protein